ncbi:hypothetical protein [Sphingobium sp.]|uniref:hypothetical protein n=1 Tax=Sphingobium sp. TaxID=1912891 RepID=UPI002605E954|nr:hypothetical protein [Sphingobium sp.]
MDKIDWCNDRKAAGGYFNNALYRVTANQPMHSDPDVVFAKVVIIGRSYSAAVTRGAGQLPTDAETEEDRSLNTFIAKSISNNSKWIDKKISYINNYDNLTINNIFDIVDFHRKFDDLIIKSIKIWRKDNNIISKKDVSSRSSFCSKYLHFHAPMHFFIMDSIAQRRLKEIMVGKNGRWPNTVWPEGWQAETETDYARFSLRMLDHAKRHYPNGWTPRLIDGHLLGYIKP